MIPKGWAPYNPKAGVKTQIRSSGSDILIAEYSLARGQKILPGYLFAGVTNEHLLRRDAYSSLIEYVSNENGGSLRGWNPERVIELEDIFLEAFPGVKARVFEGICRQTELLSPDKIGPYKRIVPPTLKDQAMLKYAARSMQAATELFIQLRKEGKI